MPPRCRVRSSERDAMCHGFVLWSPLGPLGNHFCYFHGGTAESSYSLQAGKFQAAQYKRIGKGGREIYIQASYNPIIGTDGRPYKVVKFATDVTEQKLRNADFQGQIDAVNRSQATIEFELDGTVRKANDLFLKTLGYSLDEIKGKHHSMFLDKEESSSVEYQGFWKSLAAGEFTQVNVFRS